MMDYLIFVPAVLIILPDLFLSVSLGKTSKKILKSLISLQSIGICILCVGLIYSLFSTTEKFSLLFGTIFIGIIIYNLVHLYRDLIGPEKTYQGRVALHWEYRRGTFIFYYLYLLEEKKIRKIAIGGRLAKEIENTFGINKRNENINTFQAKVTYLPFSYYSSSLEIDQSI